MSEFTFALKESEVFLVTIEIQMLSDWQGCCLPFTHDELFKRIVICNCFQRVNYCSGGSQLQSVLAQLIMEH